MKPLVSIPSLRITAGTSGSPKRLQSAISQTWAHKEIIVLDDGSKDRTAEVARRFASKGVTVVSTQNQGATAARNHAFSLSQGDYIQWVDQDESVARTRSSASLQHCVKLTAGACCSPPPGPTSTIAHTAPVSFPTSLWQDLSPVEWLLRKMGENLHMQTSNWLTSRELSEAAGPWDTRVLTDDDGEYFGRVLMASEGTRFVPGTGIFYRVTSTGRLSHIGDSG